MGKQINFLMDKETEERFLEYIKAKGEVIFEGDNQYPEVVEEFPKEFSGKGWFKLYLYNKKGELILSKLPNGRFFIDSTKAPVIELSRTVIRTSIAKQISPGIRTVGNTEIGRGRLWMETKYYDENGEVITKDSGIDEWYKDLCKWIRKNLPRTEVCYKGTIYKEYMSKSMVELIEQGYKVV